VVTGYGGIGLDYAEEHRIEATGIFLRNTEDEASLTLGQNFNFRRENGDRLRNYRIRYEQRELELLQVRGSHALGDATLDMFDWARLGFAEGLVVDWYYSEAEATTDIPSEITFSARDLIDPASGELLSTSLRSSLSAAEYRFTELEDTVTSYGWQLKMPFAMGSNAVEVSGGYDYYEKGRGYLQNQFQFGTTASAALPVLVGTPGRCSRTRTSSTRPTSSHCPSAASARRATSPARRWTPCGAAWTSTSTNASGSRRACAGRTSPASRCRSTRWSST
jgi:hypothetical protein